VLDPNVDLSQVEARQLWAEDPIHPLPIDYDKVATGVKLVEGKIGARLQAGPKRPRTESASRPRREPAPRVEDVPWEQYSGYCSNLCQISHYLQCVYGAHFLARVTISLSAFCSVVKRIKESKFLLSSNAVKSTKHPLNLVRLSL
jgi:hypothetical protein